MKRISYNSFFDPEIHLLELQTDVIVTGERFHGDKRAVAYDNATGELIDFRNWWKWIGKNKAEIRLPAGCLISWDTSYHIADLLKVTKREARNSLYRAGGIFRQLNYTRLFEGGMWVGQEPKFSPNTAPFPECARVLMNLNIHHPDNNDTAKKFPDDYEVHKGKPAGVIWWEVTNDVGAGCHDMHYMNGSGVMVEGTTMYKDLIREIIPYNTMLQLLQDRGNGYFVRSFSPDWKDFFKCEPSMLDLNERFDDLELNWWHDRIETKRLNEEYRSWMNICGDNN